MGSWTQWHPVWPLIKHSKHSYFWKMLQIVFQFLIFPKTTGWFIHLVLWSSFPELIGSLTHLPVDEMAVILQTFSNAFLWMKSSIFLFEFHRSLFLGGPIDPAFVKIMAWCWIDGRQAIIWINVDLIHWRIYAALGGDELNDDWECRWWLVP